VSRVSENARLTQARINQDITDISDASRQQKLFEYMTSGKSPQPATVLEIAPMFDVPLDDFETAAPIDDDGLPFYDLANIAGENHLAVIGGTGAGKSYLTQHLIQTYFPGAGIVAMDTDAAPHEWPGIEVVGQGCNSKAIAAQMDRDLNELQRRSGLRSNGKEPGRELVRIVEELPTLAADIQDDIDSIDWKEVGEKKPENSATNWLKRLLRRGRKYKMMVVLVSQSFNVKSLKIEGEGDLRENLTVIYLGGKSYKLLSTIRDKALREKTEQWLKSQVRPALVDVGGILMRFPVPDLSGAQLVESYNPSADDDDVIDVVGYEAAAKAQGGASKTIRLDDGEEISIDWAETTYKLIKGYLDQGFTKTMILESVGYKGSQYAKGKDLWEKLETQFGGFDA
jgi:archaellum component FlaC